MRDEKTTKNQQGSNGQNTAFHICNVGSKTHTLYALNAPFQITYEFCSGTENEDYLNIISLSENGTSYSRETHYLHHSDFYEKVPHIHDFYELLIVLDGTLIQQIEGKDFLYTAGMCCLVNRNLKHKEIFKEASKVCFVGFSPEFITELFSASGESFFQEEHQMRDSLLYRFIRSDMETPGQKGYLDFIPASNNVHSEAVLYHCAEEVILNMLFPKFGSTFLIKGFLCNIFHHLTCEKEYHTSLITMESTSDYLIFARVEHLLEESNGRISRQELASQLNYSGDYLNRLVKKYKGMCLHDYRMKFRIKKAAHDLVYTKDTISCIAERSGFTNRTYFYKVFRSCYGVTPKEYRDKSRSG